VLNNYYQSGGVHEFPVGMIVVGVVGMIFFYIKGSQESQSKSDK